MKQHLLCLLAGLIACVSPLLGQGCSDAGFCTVDALKNPETDSSETALNQFKTGVSLGKADNNITAFAAFVEYRRSIGKRWSVSTKVTQLSQLSATINRHGLSDAFLTGGFRASKGFSFIAGMKIPFTDGNRSYNNRPLPMDFQASLGTFDFIGGISWEYRRWRFTSAIQQPLTQNNNRFLSTGVDSTDFLVGFQSTNGFERRGDVLLRGTYAQPLGKKWTLVPGLLAINHLGEDSYLNASGQRMPIAGSSGLTLNGTVFVEYAIRKQHQLEVSFAAPFVVRKSRPDGLTRSVVIGLEYKWLF